MSQRSSLEPTIGELWAGFKTRLSILTHQRTIDILALLIAAAAFGLALQANHLAQQGNKLSLEALQDQRVSAAWQIISNHVTGSSGKQYALGVLLEKPGASLVGLDLGCERSLGDGMGGHEPTTPCVEIVDLSGLEVGPLASTEPSRFVERATFDGVDFSGARVSDVVFVTSSFREATFTSSTLDGVGFGNVSFVGATLGVGSIFSHGDFSDVDFSGADLSRTTFGEKVNFSQDINISGTRLCRDEEECAEGLPDSFWKHAWYWADTPPLGLGHFEKAPPPIRSGCTKYDGQPRHRTVAPSGCGVERDD